MQHGTPDQRRGRMPLQTPWRMYCGLRGQPCAVTGGGAQSNTSQNSRPGACEDSYYRWNHFQSISPKKFSSSGSDFTCVAYEVRKHLTNKVRLCNDQAWRSKRRWSKELQVSSARYQLFTFPHAHHVFLRLSEHLWYHSVSG